MLLCEQGRPQALHKSLCITDASICADLSLHIYIYMCVCVCKHITAHHHHHHHHHNNNNNTITATTTTTTTHHHHHRHQLQHQHQQGIIIIIIIIIIISCNADVQTGVCSCSSDLSSPVTTGSPLGLGRKGSIPCRQGALDIARLQQQQSSCSSFTLCRPLHQLPFGSLVVGARQKIQEKQCLRVTPASIQSDGHFLCEKCLWHLLLPDLKSTLNPGGWRWNESCWEIFSMIVVRAASIVLTSSSLDVWLKMRPAWKRDSQCTEPAAEQCLVLTFSSPLHWHFQPFLTLNKALQELTKNTNVPSFYISLNIPGLNIIEEYARVFFQTFVQTAVTSHSNHNIFWNKRFEKKTS